MTTTNRPPVGTSADRRSPANRHSDFPSFLGEHPSASGRRHSPRHAQTRPSRRPRGVRRPLAAVFAALVLVVGTLVTPVRPATVPAAAEQGVSTDSTWAPFVGEFKMWCTKALGTGSTFCASHHNGWAIDIDLPFNEPIYATGSGEVVQAYGGCPPAIGACNSGAGNWISIDHGDHWSRYIHLAAFAEGIVVGSWIEAGELVGYAGASGTSDGGVHLHYDETLPQSLPVTRIFFGPFLACHGDTAVQYPDVLGTTDWQAVPHGTMLRNDGYACLGGVDPLPPPPPPADSGPATPGGSIGLAIGDLRGDGYADLAIGIPGEDVGAHTDAGIAAVLHSGNAGLGDPESLRQGSGLRGASEAGDLAAAALAAGDFDCDGYDDLATGIPGEDRGAALATGRVHVNFGSADSIRSRKKIVRPGTALMPGAFGSGDLFGAALTTGDFDGDGCADLAMGAPGADFVGLRDAGSVSVLYGSADGFHSGTVLAQGFGLAGITEADDLVGATVSSGDYNCDGFDDLAVGAPNENVNGTPAAGAVSVVFGTASGLGAETVVMYQSYGFAGVLEAGDHLGASLASGDLNGDGCDDLAAGAPDEDLSGAIDAGAVSVAYGSASGFTSSTVHYQGTGGLLGVAQTGDRAGLALAIGNLDCDGFDDLLVGAPGEDTGQRADTGLVAIVPGSASGLNATRTKAIRQRRGLPGANEAGDGVGAALVAGDLDGDGCDEFAVAAPGEDLGTRADAGIVWVVDDLFGDTTATPLVQGKRLRGRAEAGDVLGGPPVTELLGIDADG